MVGELGIANSVAMVELLQSMKRQFAVKKISVARTLATKKGVLSRKRKCKCLELFENQFFSFRLFMKEIGAIFAYNWGVSLSRSLSTFLLFIGLYAMNLGACSLIPEEGSTSIDYSEEGELLASRVQGHWSFHSKIETNCPLDYVYNPFVDRLVWTADGHNLTISDSPNDSHPMELSAINSQELVSSQYLEWRTCTVYQDVTVFFTSISKYYLQGDYKAYYHHNGSDLCLELASDYGFDDSCEVKVSFIGRRI